MRKRVVILAVAIYIACLVALPIGAAVLLSEGGDGRPVAGTTAPAEEEDDKECYSVSSPRDRVDIIAIKPEPGMQLRRGSRVHVEAEVAYTVDSHDSAELVIHTGVSGRSRAASGRSVVNRGNSVAKLTADIEVPSEVTTIGIDVILHPPDSAVLASGRACWDPLDSDTQNYGTVSS
jgi:hypothetical protein